MHESTPGRRRLTAALCAAAGVAVMGFGLTRAVGTLAKNRSITEEQARNFAYIDAEADPAEVRFSSAEFKWEDGMYVFDVGFRTDSAFYEYEIRASDGTILESSMERIRSEGEPGTGTDGEPEEGNKETGEADEKQMKPGTKSKIVDETENKAESNPGRKYVTVDEAKAIALSFSGLTEEDVTFSEAKFETEDGRDIYSIEFYSGDREYEYDIDAVTGDLIESSVEPQASLNTDNPGGAKASANGGASGDTETPANTNTPDRTKASGQEEQKAQRSAEAQSADTGDTDDGDDSARNDGGNDAAENYGGNDHDDDDFDDVGKDYDGDDYDDVSEDYDDDGDGDYDDDNYDDDHDDDSGSDDDDDDD